MAAMLAHALQSCRSARPVLLIVLSIVGAGALGSIARTVSRAASARRSGRLRSVHHPVP